MTGTQREAAAAESPDEQDLVDVAGEPAEIVRIIDVALLEDDPRTAQREGMFTLPGFTMVLPRSQAIYLR